MVKISNATRDYTLEELDKANPKKKQWQRVKGKKIWCSGVQEIKMALLGKRTGIQYIIFLLISDSNDQQKKTVKRLDRRKVKNRLKVPNVNVG